ncbi:hypothetical protein GCM10010168_63180 [Actinoplanes ianthinogenes]|uniref:Rhodanese domain-containing protein n=1 Tax=Actinoplanes ianthinogenes TaxID=122358 RepID=A0ABM7LJK0_9ACTN|nr:hypothetical protein [Actinoplanes ianthinogenes]BCJ39434.1 hypothetical protein Aiant_00910 [Actinoplanes ianthinogenes]GGR36130.1 hypothetical protein GCM10010168_63180 [Actinoplanes ianthinogenes]
MSGWLDAALLSGAAGGAGDAARSRIFEEVRAERDGVTARRVLAWAGTELPAVRKTVFDLLDGLVFGGPEWPAAAEVAERALTGSDQTVAWAAARILVAAGGRERAGRVLESATDPVARAALVDRLVDDADPRWRSDPVPAVRLLAAVGAMRRADPGEWAALDAAIIADLEAADRMLGLSWWTAGERWAKAMVRRDREDDCYAWVARLSGMTRVYLAREAIREWRAAPGRLAPVLAGMLSEEPAAARVLMASVSATRAAADTLVRLMDDPELGAGAVVALGAAGDQRAVPRLARMMESGPGAPGLFGAVLAAVRAGVDPGALVAAARRMLATDSDQSWALRVLGACGPAAVGAVPELIARLPEAAGALGAIGPGAGPAVPALRRLFAGSATAGAAGGGWSKAIVAQALLMITGDRAPADEFLAGRPERLGRGRVEAALLSRLADHGGLTDRQHRQLRHLFERPGFPQVETAGAIWRQEGPAAAAELLEVLPQYLDDDLHGVPALRVLGAMGAHARPMLPRLDTIAESRHRLPMNVGSPDAEMRSDEILLAAVLDARERITHGK